MHKSVPKGNVNLKPEMRKFRHNNEHQNTHCFAQNTKKHGRMPALSLRYSVMTLKTACRCCGAH